MVLALASLSVLRPSGADPPRPSYLPLSCFADGLFETKDCSTMSHGQAAASVSDTPLAGGDEHGAGFPPRPSIPRRAANASRSDPEDAMDRPVCSFCGETDETRRLMIRSEDGTACICERCIMWCFEAVVERCPEALDEDPDADA